MTEAELQQLSIDVATKRGIPAWVEIGMGHGGGVPLWLHQDSKRCFELAVENDIRMNVYSLETVIRFIEVAFPPSENFTWMREYYAEHNNDKLQATRVAILKTLLASAEG